MLTLKKRTKLDSRLVFLPLLFLLGYTASLALLSKTHPLGFMDAMNWTGLSHFASATSAQTNTSASGSSSQKSSDTPSQAEASVAPVPLTLSTGPTGQAVNQTPTVPGAAPEVPGTTTPSAPGLGGGPSIPSGIDGGTDPGTTWGTGGSDGLGGASGGSGGVATGTVIPPISTPVTGPIAVDPTVSLTL